MILAQRIVSDVAGKYQYMYQTSIRVFSGDDGVIIEGSCSCPMDFNCKHVAATLIEILANEKTYQELFYSHGILLNGKLESDTENTAAADDPKANIESWLMFMNSKQKAKPKVKPQQESSHEKRRLIFILLIKEIAKKPQVFIAPKMAKIDPAGHFSEVAKFSELNKLW